LVLPFELSSRFYSDKYSKIKKNLKEIPVRFSPEEEKIAYQAGRALERAKKVSKVLPQKGWKSTFL